MQSERCFVCGSPFATADTKPQCLLERQLSAVFILRKLLNLPLESLEKCFLLSDGKDPGSWVTICGDLCQEIVDNAQSAYQEMCRARQKLKECQNQIQDKIMLSSTVSFLSSPDYRTEILETVREAVRKKNDTGPENDFAAGDRMAKQLLEIRLAISNQPIIIPPSVVPIVTPKIEPPESLCESFEEMDHDDISSDSYVYSTSSAIKVEPVSVDRTVITVKVKQRQKLKRSPTQKRPVIPQNRRKKCPHCDHWGVKRFLQKHIDTVHPTQTEAIFQCNQCDQRFNSEQRLKNHYSNHHRYKKTEKFNCSHCDYSTNQKCHLKRHILVRHEKSRVYICDICPGEFNLPENLRFHLASNHNKCSVKKCGEICESQQGLRDHQVNCHGREVDVFQCAECGKLFKIPCILKDHVMTYHRKGNEEIYACSQCDHTFVTKHRLSQHIKKSHEKGKNTVSRKKRKQEKNTP